jgi:hypothetical protein
MSARKRKGATRSRLGVHEPDSGRTQSPLTALIPGLVKPDTVMARSEDDSCYVELSALL